MHTCSHTCSRSCTKHIQIHHDAPKIHTSIYVCDRYMYIFILDIYTMYACKPVCVYLCMCVHVMHLHV